MQSNSFGKSRAVSQLGALGVVFACLFLTTCTVPRQGALPPVILKLDDAWFEGDSIHLGWVETFQYLNDVGVTATIGIVGERMEGATPAYYRWLKDQADLGHEVWNHGYCHCKPEVAGEERREFRGTTLNYQLEHLRKTQEIAASTLGLQLETFGAPYNACDDNTATALATIPELKTWLYAPQEISTGKFVLPRIAEVNIEYPVHQPDFSAFLAGFRANRKASVLVIQGHPRSWLEPPGRMAEFKAIIDFLVAEGVRFTTPSAYRKSLGR